VSESSEPVDDDVEAVVAESQPDIRYSIDNGKHLEIDIDPLEWVIILVGLTVLATVLGRFGVF